MTGEMNDREFLDHCRTQLQKRSFLPLELSRLCHLAGNDAMAEIWAKRPFGDLPVGCDDPVKMALVSEAIREAFERLSVIH